MNEFLDDYNKNFNDFVERFSLYKEYAHHVDGLVSFKEKLKKEKEDFENQKKILHDEKLNKILDQQEEILALLKEKKLKIVKEVP